MKKGEVWRIEHQRKGKLVVRLLEDISSETEFVKVAIVSGRAFFMSEMNREYQEDTGHGMEGTKLDVRVSLCKFVEKVALK